MRVTRPSLRLAILAGAAFACAVGLFAGVAAAASPGVSVVDFAFSPASITVQTGDTVVWTNTGAAPHTVTSDASGFDSGLLSSGATFSFTFATAGTYTYHCNVHPNMHGTVVVQSAAAPAAAAPAATAPARAAAPTQAQAPAAAQAKPATAQAPAAQPAAAQARVLPAAGTGGGTTDDHVPAAVGGAVVLLSAGLLLRRLARR